MEEKKSNNKRKKQIYTVFMLICIVIFLFALYKVLDIFLEYKGIDDFYKGANDDFAIVEQGRLTSIDLQKMRNINDDVKAWIYMKDMDISYPVLQGKDNNYYLFKTYTKDYLVAGSIFLDAGNNGDMTDDHTVIYGHNMHNGSMFGRLDKFMKEEFRDEHPYVNILLPDNTWHRYEIFASYIADIDDGTFKVFAQNGEAYKDYLTLVAGKNIYKNTTMPTEGEKILTLSTCTEDSDDFKRYVLQAKYVGPVDKID